MSDARRARAEIARLARLLRRDPGSLGYLAEVPTDDLRRLREQVTQVLFAPSGTLERLASASRLLPVGLVAALSERAFGAVLSARIAGLLEPRRAGQIAERLPTPFLADVAVELDPRRVEGVLAALPPGRIAEIAAELVRRGEHVAMSSFVDHLPPESLRAATAALDGDALLHIGLALESQERFDEIVGGLSRAQLEQLIDEAADAELWPETLRLTALMSPQALERFASLPRIQQPAVLERIVSVAADDPAVWQGLVPVAARLPGPAREVVLSRVRALGPERLEEFAREARKLGLSEALGLSRRRRAS
jgi:hypothetical protein